jgi:hypothetical protein
MSPKRDSRKSRESQTAGTPAIRAASRAPATQRVGT